MHQHARHVVLFFWFLYEHTLGAAIASHRRIYRTVIPIEYYG
jgi:hypothetical protein